LLLERCLEKNVRNRYHGIADARVDIERMLRDPNSAAEPGAAPDARRRGPIALPLAAAVALTAAVVGAAGWMLRPAEAPRPLVRFDYDVPAGLNLRSSGRPVLAVSADGRHFALNTLEARLIPGTEGSLTNPFFAPDCRNTIPVETLHN